MNYSQADIDFMRRDALRRTREMHKSVNNPQKNVQAEACETSQSSENKNSRCEDKSGQQSSDPISNLLSGFFQGGKIDNDKLIIIVLIIILAKEGADLKLLIALGYILM